MDKDQFKIGRMRNFLQVNLFHLRCDLRLAKFYGGDTAMIGDTFVKCSGRVRVTEALTMMFIRDNTTIPVPRVINVLTRGARVYIVMERIRGRNLERAWSSLTQEQKRRICEQLRGYTSELRSLRPPNPGRVEAVDGTACYDLRISEGLFGPFKTIDGLHTHLGYDFALERPERYPRIQETLKKCMGRHYRTVFTHGDLGLYNVLVRGGKIVAVLDWETAGWFPEYWEYAWTHWSNWRLPEFQEMIKAGAAMKTYPDELRREINMDSVFPRI